METINKEEFRKIEKYNYENLGILPEVIIENAAIKIISNIDLKNRDTFAIVCGTANNGAYGLAIARNLISYGKFVDIYIVDDIKNATNDFKKQYNIIKRMNKEINYLETIGELEDFSNKLKRVNTIIDAIVGIEYENNFQGAIEFAINTINKSRTYTISIDIPSGMDYDTGNVNISCVEPNLVVTFEYLKQGLKGVHGIYKYDIKIEKIGLIKRGNDVRY